MDLLKNRVTPTFKRLSTPVLEGLENGLKKLRTPRRPQEGPPYDPPVCPVGLETGPPDFVGIGAQKTGTSRWYMLMRHHPDVFLPDFSGQPFPHWYNKERHFFDQFFQSDFREDHIEEYHKWFPRPPGMITGEWTPRYCVDPWVAPLLARAAPETKILMFLRDPVRRFTSGMAHSQRYAPLDPSSAIEHYARGLYAHQLAYWLKFFSRSQLYVIQFEATLKDPAAKLRDTFQFLGLREMQLPETLFQKEMNARKARTDYVTPSHLRETLVERYTDEVLCMKDLVPELDLSLWPNFAHLAG